jgi:hypothetical protein
MHIAYTLLTATACPGVTYKSKLSAATTGADSAWSPPVASTAQVQQLLPALQSAALAAAAEAAAAPAGCETLLYGTHSAPGLAAPCPRAPSRVPGRLQS